VVLDSEGKQQLIYKHAISTVSPMKIVNLIFNDNRSTDNRDIRDIRNIRDDKNLY
jgi:hypothetical protein